MKNKNQFFANINLPGADTIKYALKFHTIY